MRRISAMLATFALAGLLTGCPDPGTNNSNGNMNRAANSNTANRNGVVETNVNMPANLNANNVPSNTAVVTNDNRNANTSGVRSLNANTHNMNTSNANRNGNH